MVTGFTSAVVVSPRPGKRGNGWDRSLSWRPSCAAALKVPVGKPPTNAMRGRRQDAIDDRNA
jgi:hypothetical protein